MGIRDHPIAPRSPWQNAYVERLIGSIRRECLDHMIVFGEAHLRRILRGYAAYYNVSRTHRSLNKDAPLHRAIERLGAVVSRPVLGGLHHQYCRIKFSAHTGKTPIEKSTFSTTSTQSRPSLVRRWAQERIFRPGSRRGPAPYATRSLATESRMVRPSGFQSREISPRN